MIMALNTPALIRLLDKELLNSRYLFLQTSAVSIVVRHYTVHVLYIRH